MIKIDTAVSNHKKCDKYFSTMYEAVSVIMQRVYGDLEAHNRAFVVAGYINVWNEELSEIAKGRWIDTIFGISALMSISTQLSHAKSSGVLCCEHGIPFIKLAEAASINIATTILKDSQLHLHSLRRAQQGQIERNEQSNLPQDSKKLLLVDYLELVDHARGIVVEHTNTHSVEMVFSQYPFENLIESKWLTKEVA